MTTNLQDAIQKMQEARKALEAKAPAVDMASLRDGLVATMKAVEELAKKK